MADIYKTTPKTINEPQKLGKRHGWAFSPILQKTPSLMTPLAQASSLQNYAVFEHHRCDPPGLWDAVMTGLANKCVRLFDLF